MTWLQYLNVQSIMVDLINFNVGYFGISRFFHIFALWKNYIKLDLKENRYWLNS